MDTQEVWVRVTVEFFPCINEYKSDYNFLKKAKISNGIPEKHDVCFVHHVNMPM